jgi:hypothetical protein
MEEITQSIFNHLSEKQNEGKEIKKVRRKEK